MRRIVAHMQTTLDNRIADGEGGFWEPFPWGEEEMAHVNEAFRAADTWAMGRHVYEAVVPWWEAVARGELPDDLPEVSPATADFAAILSGLGKVVFSRTLPDDPGRVVIRGDPAGALADMKRLDGRDIVLSCGPELLGTLAAVPGLVDEYLVVIHPAVLSAGPRMFDGIGTDLALRLTGARIFDGGAVVLRYATTWIQVPAAYEA